MRSLILATVLLLLATPVWSATRLAIVADADSQPVADLLMAGLSKEPGVELVEREEIDKVMREHQLSINGNLDQELNLSKLLRAQGILVLEVAKKDDGFPRGASRAAGRGGPGRRDFRHGRAAREGQRRGPFKTHLRSHPPAAAEAASRERKGRPHLDPQCALPLIPGVEPLEREVTMLLASRLASEPAVFVLERRRLDLLAGEKAYGSETPGAFWNGAYLLDGNIESDGKNDGIISIHLRLRKPGGGDGGTISAQGPAASVKELVGKLATQILKTVGQESTARQWDPAAEAAQYLDEAIWAKNQAQYQAALEAAESASALGLNSPDVYFIRTWLYAHKAASAHDLEEADHSYIEAYRTPAPLKERYAAAMKAIELCEVYLDDKLYEKLTRFDLRKELEPRNNKISQNVVSKSSEVLVELTGKPDSADMPREPLRQAIRKVAHFDPAAGIFPGDISETEEFVRYWVNGPDELVSYYCLQTHSDEPWQKEVTMAHLYYLVQGREAVFDGFPDPKGMFDRLLKMMAADPRAQLNAYFLMSAGTGPREERATAYAKFLDLYWAQRDTLMQEKIFDNYILMFYHLDQDMLAGFSAQHVRLLRYYMATPGGQFYQRVFKTLWRPQTFPPDQAADIWNEFLALKKRCEENPNTRDSVNWNDCAKQFSDAFPDLKAILPAAPEIKPLMVTRFWQPYSTPGASKDPFHPYDEDLCWSGNKLWLADKFNTGTHNLLFSIDLDTFAADSMPLPRHTMRLVVDPDAIYVTYSKQEQPNVKDDFFIGRYDRKSATWEERQIPRGELFIVNGAIYLTTDVSEGNVFISGLTRYDWAAGKIITLANSRRNPGLNQFDNGKEFLTRNIFEGPGHKVCADINGKIYFIREEPGNWDELPLPTTKKWDYFRTVTSEGRTLIHSLDGSPVYYIDPAKNAPATWVDDSGPSPWQAPSDYKVLVNRNTDTPCGITPDGFYVVGKIGDLEPHYELRWYAPGGPRAGVTIPLQFQLDGNTAAILRGNVRDLAKLDPHSSDLTQPEKRAFPLTTISTARGVVLLNIIGGFWFIPYSDIDAYIKAHPKASGQQTPGAAQ